MERERQAKTETIYLAGGCFWGTQRYLDLLPGVLSTEAGYANGQTEAPTYEEVKHRHTGHAETVRVTFDPAVLPLSELLNRFFLSIDPLSLNRQGEDEGVQYRTGVYYETEEQKDAVETSLAALQERYDAPIAVEGLPLSNFYPAEEYHQKYLEKNPAGYCHLSPALFEAARQFRKEKLEKL